MNPPYGVGGGEGKGVMRGWRKMQVDCSKMQKVPPPSPPSDCNNGYSHSNNVFILDYIDIRLYDLFKIKVYLPLGRQ